MRHLPSVSEGAGVHVGEYAGRVEEKSQDPIEAEVVLIVIGEALLSDVEC